MHSRLSPCSYCSRRWITILALLAFFFQGLAIQTHVHQLLQPVVAKVQAENSHKGPIKLDPMDQCRLCQELVHAGTFIAPSAIASPVSLTFVAVRINAVPATLADPVAGFGWQGRAPPRN